MKRIISTVCAGAALLSSAPAQINWSGQAGVGLLKSAVTESPRVYNAGRPTFSWESDLFLDAVVSDDVAILSGVRAATQDYLYVDYLAIRLTGLTSLNFGIQAGKFNMPFGNLGDRRYPRNNALYGLPVIYEYNTALQNHPESERDLLRSRGEGTGLRLLDGGIYDVGVMAFGAFGPVTVAIAVSNGTVSQSSYGTRNRNSGFGTIIRVAAEPATGLTIGAAFNWGPYLYQDDSYSPGLKPVSDYQQKTGELDVSFSRGHVVLHAEGVYGSWEVPLQQYKAVHLGVFGYYAEGKYTFLPRWFLALRYSGLVFGKGLLDGARQQWDYDVGEWEGGIGYFLERDVVVKLVRRETRIYGGTRPKDNLTVLQLAVAF